MSFLRLTALSLLMPPLLAFSVYAETNSVYGPAAEGSEPEEWPYTLPIFGKEAVAQGYEIPLPYGIGISHMYAERGIDVTSVYAGINGANNDVSSLLDVEVKTEVNTTVSRLDAWLFPFMNVYGFTGYVRNKSPVVFNVDASGIGGSSNVVVKSRFDLSGPTYGGGVVLAGGYLDYFMTLDANFFKADLDGSVQEEFTGSTYTFRAGWNGKIEQVPTRFWLGISYWNTQSEVTGSIPFLGNNTIDFKVDQEPENPANFNLGGYVEMTKRLHLVVDLGSNFDDAFTALVELNCRIF